VGGGAGMDEYTFPELESGTRTMLFILLLLAVGVVIGASIMFSANSRVFLLKSSVAALLSVLPGWVYLQFVRNKGPSLYDEYVLNLFRLQIDRTANLPAPPMHTTWYPVWKECHDDVVTNDAVKDNLYRRKFEAVYGPSSVSTIALTRSDGKLSFKERTETFGPVVMATIVIALAWALVLQPELLGRFELLSSDFQLSGQPVLPADPLRFAFLGAYAFILLDLSRRYFRDDLKSAAFLSFTTRIVFASALVIAADQIGVIDVEREPQANAIAFFIGFFPRSGFTWLRALLPKGFQSAVPQLESDYPLRDLEGLNVWYESRLIEEGIESMQNLCTASLVDLLLKTRLPVMRVVDWLDQAFLYLHLPKSGDAERPPGLRGLRTLGIRTATDLRRVAERPDRSPQVDRALAKALRCEVADVDGVVSSVLSSFEGEPNLWHVQAFRSLSWLKEEPIDGGQAQGAPVERPTVHTAPAAAQAMPASAGNGHGRRRHSWAFIRNHL
jgi:hypothetical protein